MVLHKKSKSVAILTPTATRGEKSQNVSSIERKLLLQERNQRCEDRTRYNIALASVRAELGRKVREILDLQQDNSEKALVIHDLKNHVKALQTLHRKSETAPHEPQATRYPQSLILSTANHKIPLIVSQDTQENPVRTPRLEKPWSQQECEILGHEVIKAFQTVKQFVPLTVPVREWHQCNAQVWSRLTHAFESITFPPHPTHKIIQLVISHLIAERDCLQKLLCELHCHELSVMKKFVEISQHYQVRWKKYHEDIENYDKEKASLEFEIHHIIQTLTDLKTEFTMTTENLNMSREDRDCRELQCHIYQNQLNSLHQSTSRTLLELKMHCQELESKLKEQDFETLEQSFLKLKSDFKQQSSLFQLIQGQKIAIEENLRVLLDQRSVHRRSISLCTKVHLPGVAYCLIRVTGLVNLHLHNESTRTPWKPSRLQLLAFKKPFSASLQSSGLIRHCFYCTTSIHCLTSNTKTLTSNKPFTSSMLHLMTLFPSNESPCASHQLFLHSQPCRLQVTPLNLLASKIPCDQLNHFVFIERGAPVEREYQNVSSVKASGPRSHTKIPPEASAHDSLTLVTSQFRPNHASRNTSGFSPSLEKISQTHNYKYIKQSSGVSFKLPTDQHLFHITTGASPRQLSFSSSSFQANDTSSESQGIKQKTNPLNFSFSTPFTQHSMLKDEDNASNQSNRDVANHVNRKHHVLLTSKFLSASDSNTYHDFLMQQSQSPQQQKSSFLLDSPPDRNLPHCKMVSYSEKSFSHFPQENVISTPSRKIASLDELHTRVVTFSSSETDFLSLVTRPKNQRSKKLHWAFRKQNIHRKRVNWTASKFHGKRIFLNKPIPSKTSNILNSPTSSQAEQPLSDKEKSPAVNIQPQDIFNITDLPIVSFKKEPNFSIKKIPVTNHSFRNIYKMLNSTPESALEDLLYTKEDDTVTHGFPQRISGVTASTKRSMLELPFNPDGESPSINHLRERVPPVKHSLKEEPKKQSSDVKEKLIPRHGPSQMASIRIHSVKTSTPGQQFAVKKYSSISSPLKRIRIPEDFAKVSLTETLSTAEKTFPTLRSSSQHIPGITPSAKGSMKELPFSPDNEPPPIHHPSQRMPPMKVSSKRAFREQFSDVKKKFIPIRGPSQMASTRMDSVKRYTSGQSFNVKKYSSISSPLKRIPIPGDSANVSLSEPLSTSEKAFPTLRSSSQHIPGVTVSAKESMKELPFNLEDESPPIHDLPQRMPPAKYSSKRESREQSSGVNEKLIPTPGLSQMLSTRMDSVEGSTSGQPFTVKKHSTIFSSLKRIPIPQDSVKVSLTEPLSTAEKASPTLRSPSQHIPGVTVSAKESMKELPFNLEDDSPLIHHLPQRMPPVKLSSKKKSREHTSNATAILVGKRLSRSLDDRLVKTTLKEILSASKNINSIDFQQGGSISTKRSSFSLVAERETNSSNVSVAIEHGTKPKVDFSKIERHQLLTKDKGETFTQREEGDTLGVPEDYRGMNSEALIGNTEINNTESLYTSSPGEAGRSQPLTTQKTEVEHNIIVSQDKAFAAVKAVFSKDSQISNSELHQYDTVNYQVASEKAFSLERSRLSQDRASGQISELFTAMNVILQKLCLMEKEQSSHLQTIRRESQKRHLQLQDRIILDIHELQRQHHHLVELTEQAFADQRVLLKEKLHSEWGCSYQNSSHGGYLQGGDSRQPIQEKENSARLAAQVQKDDNDQLRLLLENLERLISSQQLPKTLDPKPRHDSPEYTSQTTFVDEQLIETALANKLTEIKQSFQSQIHSLSLKLQEQTAQNSDLRLRLGSQALNEQHIQKASSPPQPQHKRSLLEAESAKPTLKDETIPASDESVNEFIQTPSQDLNSLKQEQPLKCFSFPTFYRNGFEKHNSKTLFLPNNRQYFPSLRRFTNSAGLTPALHSYYDTKQQPCKELLTDLVLLRRSVHATFIQLHSLPPLDDKVQCAPHLYLNQRQNSYHHTLLSMDSLHHSKDLFHTF